MQRLQQFTSNFVFFLLILLGFLLVFESYVTVPFWLQPIGRMHPMLLHFPIALIVVMVLLDVFKAHIDPESYQKIHTVGLNLTVLTTAVSAIMGFLLSKEEGYSSELMDLHKWVGVSVTYLVYLLLLFDPSKFAYKFLLYGSFVILFFAGHFGAGLTHGMDFLMEPIASTKKPEITEETPIFEAFIDPILEDKCKGCHNPQKHKGELDLSTYELMLEGGENGPVIEIGDALESELIHRTILPLEMEEHMPPEGKPQLTDFEIELLSAWIDSGADPIVSLSQVTPADTLFHLAQQQLSRHREGSQGPRYDFDFAGDKLIASLNNPYRTVIQQTPESPALDANIFVRQAYKKEYLEDLDEVKQQLVNLNLSYMPVTDEDLSTIGRFSNLETLNLNYTDITGEGFSNLKSCTKLRSLSVSGTAVTFDHLENLAGHESLEDVYLWNTKIDRSQAETLISDMSGVNFYTGYTTDQEAPIPLTSPQLKNKSNVLKPGEKLLLEHKLPGVVIRYTIDGTDPDSVSSDVYSDPIEITGLTTVKTVAYKEQWLTSDTATFKIFTAGPKAKQVDLLHNPDPEYPGRGAQSLTDLAKGKASNFRGSEWLGFRNAPMEATFDFGEEPPEVTELVFSFLVSRARQIMPPASIEVWGGNNKEALTLLARKKMPLDDKSVKSGVTQVELEFEPSRHNYYLVKAKTVDKLPSWHKSKGKPGWLFVDELFFY